MSVKVFWWVLLIGQLLLYCGVTPLKNLPGYGEVWLVSFEMAWGSVAIILYGYWCKKKNKTFHKLFAIILLLLVLVIVTIFAYYFSLGGYILGFWVIVLSYLAFLFTVILSVKTLVFVRENK